MTTDAPESTQSEVAPFSFGVLLKFILPSLMGILLFLVPVEYDGKQTIVLGLISDWLRAPVEHYVLEIVVAIVVLAALSSAYYVLVKPDWKHSHPTLYAMSRATPLWLGLRVLGALIGFSVYFQIGPELIWGQGNGHTVFMEIGVTMFFILLPACLFMPLLTDYGFMELVGTLFHKPFEVLFQLPGRAAIDATASFVAASSVGVLITVSQYEKGFYSARESAAVATNFSIVSVPFSLLIANVAGIEHLFFTWYLVVIIACLVCALITVRIAPLNKIPNTYFNHQRSQAFEHVEVNESLIVHSLNQALKRAREASSPVTFLRNGWLNAVDVIFGVIAPSMAIATVTAIIVFHTPIFDYLSYPLFYLLEVLHFPEAKQAAPGFLIGFFDQFMPALVAQKIDSQFTSFVLAGLSVSQLIYMAEVGILILRSSLPLTFFDLLHIFLIRTLILFPIFWLAAMMLF